MTAAQSARQDIRDRGGKYAEGILADAGQIDLEEQPVLFGGFEPEVAEAPAPEVRPFSMDLKPGEQTELDVGRGREVFTVLGATDTNGRRFVQAEDGALFEVAVRAGKTRVTATPENLAARARLLSAFYAGKVMHVRTYGRMSSGGLHLDSCRHSLLFETDTNATVTPLRNKAWAGKTRTELVEEMFTAHRAAVEGTTGGDRVCECIRNGQAA